MNKQKIYDYIIIGAGCSGLSLAIQLHKAGVLANKTVLLLDRRQEYHTDKSWCGWGVRQHDFESCVTKRWSCWDVGYQEQYRVHHCEEFQYQYIAAGDFYRYCLDYISNTTAIDLQLGVTVKTIQNNVVMCNNMDFHGKVLFDARAPASDVKLTGNFLWQCFYGWHISVPRPVFEPQRATLMDFYADQRKGINFIYLLPFSETEALIEPTYFLHHHDIPNKDHFFTLARNYLKKRYHCEDMIIHRCEQGTLPMVVTKSGCATTDTNIIRIGSAHGILRPSTGYAFYTIQRFNRAIVHALKHSAPLPRSPYRHLTIWMDQIFLRVCHRYPTTAAKIFYQLFARANTQAIIRFMQDEATVTNYLNIINSVPSWPFLCAALGKGKRHA